MASAAGFVRAAVMCVNCKKAFLLFLTQKGFSSIKELPDPFLAQCPECRHEANYPKSAIQILRAEDGQ